MSLHETTHLMLGAIVWLTGAGLAFEALWSEVHRQPVGLDAGPQWAPRTMCLPLAAHRAPRRTNASSIAGNQATGPMLGTVGRPGRLRGGAGSHASPSHCVTMAQAPATSWRAFATAWRTRSPGQPCNMGFCCGIAPAKAPERKARKTMERMSVRFGSVAQLVSFCERWTERTEARLLSGNRWVAYQDTNAAGLFIRFEECTMDDVERARDIVGYDGGTVEAME